MFTTGDTVIVIDPTSYWRRTKALVIRQYGEGTYLVQFDNLQQTQFAQHQLAII